MSLKLKNIFYGRNKLHNGFPVNWLEELLPIFPMRGENIEVLFSPTKFYERLCTNITEAKYRITWASLYLGNGDLENLLVKSLSNKLADSNVEVKILLDYSRGSRGLVNSRTQLLPLLNYASKCQVAFFHSPYLRGISKKILPDRWNEIVSLQHMKIYIFDDNIICSGANLSSDYFVNRQDRYVVIKNSDLSDYLNQVIASLMKISLQLNSDDEVELHKDWEISPVHGDYDQYIEKSKELLHSCLSPPNLYQGVSSDCDTWINPLFQMPFFDVRKDEEVTSRLLSSNMRLKLATGYFNLTDEYTSLLISKQRLPADILTAHPTCNGFLGASGLSGYIPSMYVTLTQHFMDIMAKHKLSHLVKMYEFRKEGWTYHGKGMWLYPEEGDFPILTLIGSPNFGYRSVFRDMELQLLIVTSNEHLGRQLNEEYSRLFQYGSAVTEGVLTDSHHQVPYWVDFLSHYIKKYF